MCSFAVVKGIPEMVQETMDMVSAAGLNAVPQQAALQNQAWKARMAGDQTTANALQAELDQSKPAAQQRVSDDEDVNRVIDDIWQKYDKNNNNVLDQEEFKLYVRESMGELGMG